jgi:hypothetical protein
MGMVVVVRMGVIMVTTPLVPVAGGLQSGLARRVVRVLPSVNANLSDDIASAIFTHG